MRKKVAIFGSTGSIGTSTLQVIRNNPHLFEVVTLVAGNNVDLLIEQAKEFMPKYLYIKDASNASKLFNVLFYIYYNNCRIICFDSVFFVCFMIK